MGTRDWAVVIGLAHYPGMGSLDGPENDANLFYDWLVSKKGGNVPRRQIKKIVSSDYKPLTRKAIHARPNREELTTVFEELQVEAAAAPEMILGRRLYIYMAGHGFADLRDTSEQTGLLSAKATRLNIGGQHILGQYTATWFRRAGYFEEVVLFMDCCREAFPAPPFNFPWDTRLNAKILDQSRYFHGFASGWMKKARERKMEDGLVHGVFTWTLVKGLELAVDRDTGIITASSLSSYLYQNMKEFLSAGDKRNPDIAKEPQIDFSRNPGAQIVFGERISAGEVQVPTFEITLEVPPTLRGQTIVIGDGLREIAQAKPNSTQWKLRLEQGLYSVTYDDKELLFSVKGSGDVTVKL